MRNSTFGITGRLIAAIDREASPEAAVEMVQWVIDNRCDEVIGIGIDYRENDRPPELFTQAYADARRAGLKTTAHAGEFGMPWTNVRTALDLLQVDRIDHGYTVVDRPEFARECAERGVIFTVVPTNSYYLRTLPPERWALDHPIRRMPGLGLRIHPNTDDPTLHKVTPTAAWLMMVRDFGFGRDDLRGFMHNGLDGAWIDDTLAPPMARRLERRIRPAPRRRAPTHPGDPMKNPLAKPLLLACTLLAALPGAASAQPPAWPGAKPITLIVPYSAGGSVDFTARLVATKLGERLKQSVVIENVDRRRRRHRRGQGGQRGARRLHPGGRAGQRDRDRPPDQSGRLQVRSPEGPGAGRHAEHGADGAGRPSRPAGRRISASS